MGEEQPNETEQHCVNGDDLIDCLELEDSFRDILEGEEEGVFTNLAFWEKKGHLFRNLLIQMFNYNSYLIECVKLVDHRDPQKLPEIKQPVKRANKQIEKGLESLKKGDLISGLGLFYSAHERRLWILQILDEIDDERRSNGYDIESLEAQLNLGEKKIEGEIVINENNDSQSDRSRLEGFVDRLIQKGGNSIGTSWADQTKDQLLTNNSENLKENTTVEDIIIKYREYYSTISDRIVLIAKVRLLLRIILFLLAFIVVLLFSITYLLDTSIIFDLYSPPAYTDIDGAPFKVVYQYYFIYLVFVLGILGSAVNTVRTWPNQLTKIEPTQLQLSLTRLFIGVRLLVGGIAAFLVYVLLVSGIIIWQGGVTPGQILIASFAAGFSDQFFIAGIGRIVSSEKEEEDMVSLAQVQDEERD